jgi:phosphopantetheinyl transferase
MLNRFRETGKHLDTTSGNAPFSPHITYDRMGKPRLVLNGALEPSISFSHCDGMTWGAMAVPALGIGIDAARADEFGQTYPFHKVFSSGELEPLLEKTDDLDESAALLWSAKEAFVKALGCGFHLFSALGVRVSLLHWEHNSATLKVRLSETVLEKLTLDVGSQIEIASFRFVGAWVSVALLDRNCLDRTGSRFSCIRSDNCATL